MRLVALDLETTGLNPQRDQILEVGMVCFESDTGEIVGEFETLVRHSEYHGDAYALSMNAALLNRLAEGEGVYYTELDRMVGSALIEWGFGGSDPHAVGFNVAPFDIAFLKAAGIDMFHHRAIELGSLLMQTTFDSRVPVSSKAFTEARGAVVAHTALADCHMAVAAYMCAMELV